MKKNLRFCSSYKEPFDDKDIRNNLCEKCLAVEVVKNWLQSDEAKGVQAMRNDRITVI